MTSRARLGRAAQGGRIAAPIAKDFMKLALADKPPTPFKVPPGIRLVRIDSKSGMRPAPGEGWPHRSGSLQAGHRAAGELHAAPVGVADGEGRVPQGYPPEAGSIQGGVPDAGNIMRPGTGRLY